MTPMSTPSRSLHLTGATNFRDLGGYLTSDGRRLRWRRLFRSDHLASLTASDRRVLADLGLARSFDFRGDEERETTAYALPGVQIHALPIPPSVVQNLQLRRDQGQTLDAGAAAEVMEQTYEAFVERHSERFATLLQHLVARDVPTVFHCTAGKDRTGFAAALILSALGVPRETIVHDFLLTNELFRRPDMSSRHDLPQEVIAVLWGVQARFLERALATVERHHGSVDAYLTHLGLGPAERRELARHYLEN